MNSIISNDNRPLHSAYELGRLYYHRCEFSKAEESLKMASEYFKKAQMWVEFQNSQSMLLRIYSEEGRWEAIQNIKEDFLDLIIGKGVEPTSKIFYVLANCATYRDQFEVALDYLEKSIQIAGQKNDFEGLCYALYGKAAIYYFQSKKDESILVKFESLIQQLKEFLDTLNNNDLVISFQSMMGSHFLSQGKLAEAEQMYNKALELAQNEKSILYTAMVQSNLGRVYVKMGNFDLARLYFKLALQSLDEKYFSLNVKEIKIELEKLGMEILLNHDLSVDFESQSFFERNLGRISLGGQFVLSDLLKLFVENPGVVFSKQELIEKVWKENYNPEIHDNKIYVTVKRLRMLIEPNQDETKYIFRSKKGYYFSTTVKVQIKETLPMVAHSFENEPNNSNIKQGIFSENSFNESLKLESKTATSKTKINQFDLINRGDLA